MPTTLKSVVLASLLALAACGPVDDAEAPVGEDPVAEASSVSPEEPLGTVEQQLCRTRYLDFFGCYNRTELGRLASKGCQKMGGWLYSHTPYQLCGGGFGATQARCCGL